MTRCPACAGRLSTPILGRRTKLWLSSCSACGYTSRSQEPPTWTQAQTANHSGMFQQQATEYTPAPERLTRFPRLEVGAELKRAILKRRELDKLNATDGKLKQGGTA